MKTPDSSHKMGAPSGQPRRWLADGWCALALLAAVLLVYSPALRGGVLWDDDDYIYNNVTLRSLKGLWEIWFKPSVSEQYYPLTFSGWWAGYHLWGLHTMGFHLANACLHALAAVLLWQVLKRLKAPGALLAGVLFALHPVNVMSVAWMTEFKNTLSGSLALAAAWAYLRFEGLGVYAEREGRQRSWNWYAMVLALFQLAMFSKTAVSFLPVSLLLITWWQRGRIGWREIAPLLPLVGIVAAMGSFTLYIEHTSGGASGRDFALSFPEKIIVSGRSFWFYLGKLFYPVQLSFFYPRWDINTDDWREYLYPGAMMAFLAGLWLLRRRIGRGPFAAAMHFYLSTSFLVLVVVLYMMKFTFVADHWEYYGTMSAMPVIAWAVMRLRQWREIAGKGAMIGLPVLLAILTWRQCAMYTDIDTFYRTIIERNPGCWIAHNNLGVILLQKGEIDEAIAQFQDSLEAKPDYCEGRTDLGFALMKKGEVGEAIAQFQKVLAMNPRFGGAEYNLGLAMEQLGQTGEAIFHFERALALDRKASAAHYDLGLALQRAGQLDQAITHYQRALEIFPDMPDARLNLGNALAQKGEMNEAITQFEKALEIKPDYAVAHYDLGLALQVENRVDEAIAHYQKALEIEPGYMEAHMNLGHAFEQKGEATEAIAQYEVTLRVQPGLPEALNSLAYVLATCPVESLRDGAKAVRLAEQANEAAGGNNPVILGTLAAAYAETGQFPKAVESAQKALDLANSRSDAKRAEVLRKQLALYEASMPLRDSRPGN